MKKIVDRWQWHANFNIMWCNGVVLGMIWHSMHALQWPKQTTFNNTSGSV